MTIRHNGCNVYIMATHKEHTDFAAALAELTSGRPDLAETLGDDPTRAQLLDTVEALAPAVAPSAKSMPKVVSAAHRSRCARAAAAAAGVFHHAHP